MFFTRIWFYLIKVFRTHNTKPERIEDFAAIASYWEERYEHGGNSGAGSYGLPAIYKADFVNQTMDDLGIKNVIDFGCGDGHQLSLLNMDQRSYVGLDISAESIQICRSKFQEPNIRFLHVTNYETLKLPYSELSVSMDVIYHLTEDAAYFTYLDYLFNSSKFVLIYSMDQEDPKWTGHSRPREFSKDIVSRFPAARLLAQVESSVPEEVGMYFFLYQNS